MFVVKKSTSSSRHISMVSKVACYWGGPGFKSQQGQEFINFWLQRKFKTSKQQTRKVIKNTWRWPFNHPSHLERTIYCCLSRIHSWNACRFFFFFQFACIVHRNRQDKLSREERGFERFSIKRRRKTGIRSLDPCSYLLLRVEADNMAST